MPNNGYVGSGTEGDIYVNVITDGTSGIPAKNRGICMDGVEDGIIKAYNFMVGTKFMCDMWVFSWEESINKTCTLADKVSAMNFGIDYAANGANTMYAAISSSGSRSVTQQQAFYIQNENWLNLVYSFCDQGGKDTLVQYYIDGELVK